MAADHWCLSLNQLHYFFQINARGFITFPTDTNFAGGIGPYVTVDLGIIVNGTVYYRTTTDQELLCRASHKVRSVFLDRPNYDATWMLVVTWRTSLYSFFNRGQGTGRVKRGTLPDIEETEVGMGLNRLTTCFFKVTDV